MSFTPSAYQQKIIDWALNPSKKHGICNAVAGSGKSSTLKLVAMALNNSGVHHGDIKIIVFAKQNQIDLVEKFPHNWKNSISTLHSVGYQIANKAIAEVRQVTDYKYKKIGRDLRLLPTKEHQGDLLKDEAISSQTQFLTLFNLARLNLSDFSPESLGVIARHHNLDELYKFDLISGAMEDMKVIGLSYIKDYGKYDYTDLIYQPVSRVGSCEIRFVTNKFVLVDECQDLNPCQLALSKLKEKTQELFSNDKGFICLSTIHRAKGLEADNVYILEPDMMPLLWRKQQPWEYQQEMNLLYVALTRSKSKLYVMGEALWLRNKFVNSSSSTFSITT